MIEAKIDGSDVSVKLSTKDTAIKMPTFIIAIADLQTLVEGVLRVIEQNTDVGDFFDKQHQKSAILGACITGLLGNRFNDDLEAIQSFIDEYIITFFKDFNGEDEKE